MICRKIDSFMQLKNWLIYWLIVAKVCSVVFTTWLFS